MPDIQLNLTATNPVTQVTIRVEEPHRSLIYQDQLLTAGNALLTIAGNNNYAKVRPALIDHLGGDQNLSVMLTKLGQILDIHVASAIANEIGENDQANNLRAFYWQGNSPVDNAAANALNFLQHTQAAGVKAYYRFLQLSLDRNFNPANALPTQNDVNGRNAANYRANGIQSFFGRHANLQARVTQVQQNFVAFIGNIIGHLLSDWADIERYFFGGNTVNNLTKITISGSDTHKGGQQVAFLDMSGNRKLVYKPSDIEWDALIIGDVTSLAQMQNQLTGNAAETVARWTQVANANNFNTIEGLNTPRSLAQLFNGLRPTGLMVTTPPSMATYKILPCRAGSTLQQQNDGSRRIRRSYGYIEFLTSDRANDRTFPSANHSSFKTYGYQIGQWLALMMLTNITDIHQENLFICNKKPYPIDLEITDFGYTDNPRTTLLFSQGISNMPELAMIFELTLGANRVSAAYQRLAAPGGDPYMKNQAFAQNAGMITPANADIRRGLKATYDIILNKFASFSAFLMFMLPGVVVRRLPPQMSTGNLISLFGYLLGKTNNAIRQECTNRQNQRLALWESRAVQWKGVYPADTLLKRTPAAVEDKQKTEDINTKNLQPDFAVYASVATDIINGDIPTFYQLYGGTELMNSSGQLVTATANQQTPTTNQTVSDLYPFTPTISNGQIKNYIPRPQSAIQTKSLRDLTLPVLSNYDSYIATINRHLA